MDNRLQQVLYVDFKKQNFWQRGKFQGQYENGTLLTNPWYTSDNKNAPFDQQFYLILDLAIGSRNGYFPYVLMIWICLHSTDTCSAEMELGVSHG